MADAGCKSCIVDAQVEISHNNVDWYDVPAVQRITKAYQDSQANRTRHSHSGGQFVTPCGTDSRTPVYTVQCLVCNDDPLHWYLRDGDIVHVRITKGQSSPFTSFSETLEAKYVDGGFDWDNTSEDGEEITFTLEATSAVAYTGIAGPVSAPYDEATW